MCEEGVSEPEVKQQQIAELGDMLPLYYKRLFPHKPFYRWLSYGLSEEGIFCNREISFTLRDDIYIRYLCFEDQSDLEKEICTRSPYKIDIGAVMSSRPKNFRVSSAAMAPIQRELVFDIDMTDYDDVRTCCSKAAVCQKCWKFMVAAARILDEALREDFGFEQMLWIFSGRRGVHCWVCDYAARHLDTRGRTAVAEYLQLISYVMINGVNVPRIQIGDRMHHSMRRALKHIEPVFEQIALDDQNLFGTPEGVAKLLRLVPDENARKELEAYFRSNHEDGAHSKVIWKTFTRYAHSKRTSGESIWNRRMKHIIEEIKLCILYPRLDINVTKGFNHLLKAPFCIHPATGKVCVPFNVAAVAKFDPTNVPTIVQLLQEINAFDDEKFDDTDDKSRIKDHKKTSMFKGVLVFEEFLRKLENDLKNKSSILADKKLDF